MFFLDLFIMFNRGGHFDCDLFTMCDRETRKKGYFYIVSDVSKTFIRGSVGKS